MESEEKQRIIKQQKLITACRKNNRRAQLKLYNQYFRAMYTVCLNLVHNSDVAEDLMQEAFISAFGNIHTFEGEVSFGAWLKKITINKCIDYLKKKKINFVSIENLENLPENELFEQTEFYSKFSVEQIKGSIKQLPEGYRTILSLYLFEGFDHQEIAQILGITSSTSRSQYVRAKTTLIKKLNMQK